jgi:hypothetical protein
MVGLRKCRGDPRVGANRIEGPPALFAKQGERGLAMRVRVEDRALGHCQRDFVFLSAMNIVNSVRTYLMQSSSSNAVGLGQMSARLKLIVH